VDGTPVGEIGARGELGVGHLCGLANGFGREGAAGEHDCCSGILSRFVGCC
jgi:hypothetical protein